MAEEKLAAPIDPYYAAKILADILGRETGREITIAIMVKDEANEDR